MILYRAVAIGDAIIPWLLDTKKLHGEKVCSTIVRDVEVVLSIGTSSFKPLLTRSQKGWPMLKVLGFFFEEIQDVPVFSVRSRQKMCDPQSVSQVPRRVLVVSYVQSGFCPTTKAIWLDGSQFRYPPNAWLAAEAIYLGISMNKWYAIAVFEVNSENYSCPRTRTLLTVTPTEMRFWAMAILATFIVTYYITRHQRKDFAGTYVVHTASILQLSRLGVLSMSS